MKPEKKPEKDNPPPQTGGEDDKNIKFPTIPSTNDVGQLAINPDQATFPKIDLNELGFKLLNLGDINTNDWGDESTPD